ncbi:MAG: carbon-nitrogen hydrolase family protein, partial [Deltaproteobacteria bacterium]|nr:carbon-nitrogen hydrolase family protein [Deltaproteobacteria bacterium]
MKEIVAAAVQLAPVPCDPQANLVRVAAAVEEAAREHGAELVVLPESVLTGFHPGARQAELWELAEPLPGPASLELGKLARSLGIHLVLPLYERGSERGVVYNSSALLDDRGELCGVYRKTHPFPTERLERGGWTTPGQQAVVVPTRLGRIGMILCYDGDFPELSRVCALQGAEIVTRASALLRSFEIWELTNRARAYDNHVYVVAVNAVGADAGGSHYFGHSMIVSPIAQMLALARGSEEIVSARLGTDPLASVTYGSKKPQIFDHLADRNLAAYDGLLRPGTTSFPLHR